MRGKGQDYECPTFGNGDHPRLCGEKELSSVALSPNKGSPPPMRGKDVPKGQRLLVVGITPAYAGKRLARVFVHFASRDHPRLCGEKLASTISPPLVVGSPPPMRGKANVIASAFGTIQDHPRLCGEKQKKQPAAFLTIGSPPPMRGKVRLAGRAFKASGITPAYAGKSF